MEISTNPGSFHGELYSKWAIREPGKKQSVDKYIEQSHTIALFFKRIFTYSLNPLKIIEFQCPQKWAGHSLSTLSLMIGFKSVVHQVLSCNCHLRTFLMQPGWLCCVAILSSLNQGHQMYSILSKEIFWYEY